VLHLWLIYIRWEGNNFEQRIIDKSKCYWEQPWGTCEEFGEHNGGTHWEHVEHHWEHTGNRFETQWEHENKNLHLHPTLPPILVKYFCLAKPIGACLKIG